MSDELELNDDDAPETGTERWQERRARGIGASEAPAALGLSRWRTPLELYLRKRREIPPEPETYDMTWGKVMEPAIVQLYQQTRDVELRYPLPLAEHPQHPIVLATGDAELSPDRGMEIKTMQHWAFRKLQAQGLADAYPEYVIQSQQQMVVMGWAAVVLVILVDRTLHEFEIERDDQLIDDIVCADLELWQRIESGNPPPIDFNRPDAYRAVMALWGGRKLTPRIVDLSPGSVADWERQRELAAVERQAAADRKLLKAPVVEEIIKAGGNAGRLPGGKIVKLIETPESTYTATRKAGLQVRECNDPEAAKPARKR